MAHVSFAPGGPASSDNGHAYDDATHSPRGPLRVTNDSNHKHKLRDLNLQHISPTNTEESLEDSRQNSLGLDPANANLLLDVMIKVRLIPVALGLKHSRNSEDISHALTEAYAVHQYAEACGASTAIVARCCYYIAVGEHGVNGKDRHRSRTYLWFEKALDAAGVYDESIWAQQWIDYYDDLTLNPDRSEAARRKMSSFGAAHDRVRAAKAQLQNSDKSDIRHTELLTEPEPGVLILTPVSKRFSLDVRDDYTSPNSPNASSSRRFSREMSTISDDYNTDSPPSTSDRSGGERIPDFSSEEGSDYSTSPCPSLTTGTTVQSIANFSPDFNLQQQTSPSGRKDAAFLAEELDRAQSPKTPSKPERPGSSGTMAAAVAEAEAREKEEERGLLERREQGRTSIFDTSFVKRRVSALLFPSKESKLTEGLMEDGESPEFGLKTGGSVKVEGEEGLGETW
ncbi:hypothetical protein TI39_contig4100g00010 [Zymoseptoria brevis]|uniref:Uncharacterized protein n=1 Tax=Zymoseptoria brevis TaxID=1047168 RepID=A0A0F4GF75_9PEZI|nr:hypothetical protein TI39_contig4100g00010 [Zymoseptoria brevis]